MYIIIHVPNVILNQPSRSCTLAEQGDVFSVKSFGIHPTQGLTANGKDIAKSDEKQNSLKKGKAMMRTPKIQ